MLLSGAKDIIIERTYMKMEEKPLYVSNQKKMLVNEKAVQKILALIKDKDLQSGDKLPTERALCQQLGISRTSLREALHNLKANGIVRIRQGSGIYVDAVDESVRNQHSELDELNYHNVITVIHQMLEARIMIESHCARRVAKIITPEQLNRLWEHEMQEYQRSFYSDPRNEIARFPRTDFESLIISFLGNPITSNIYNRLSSSWKSYLDNINAVILEPAPRHRQHVAIINALEERNPDKAEEAVLYHLEKSKESVLLLIEHNKDAFNNSSDS